MMKKYWIAAATAALMVISAGAQNVPTAQQIAARLTANDLKADISFLASDTLQGRATPSPGQDVAAEFIAAQFRRAGLDPVGDDGYFQTAAFATVTPNTEGMEFSVEAGSTPVKAQSGAITLQQPGAADFSRSPVVKVMGNDAAALNALTAEQVRGKVLLVDFPDGANAMAANRMIPTLGDKLQPALIVLLRSGGQPTNTTARLREATGSASIPILIVWDEAVRTALAAAKPGPIDATVSVHIPAPTVVPVKLRNVAGVLRGSDPTLRDTYVIVTGHYDHLGVRGTGEGDHLFNGANDDASGTASVIEIANALAAQPMRPKRSILFLTVFGEEVGELGSRYYAQHPIFPLAKTVADLNLEQLGRTDVDGGTSIGLVNITGFDFSTLTDFIKKAGDATGLKVVKDEQRNVSYFARSDNQWLANVGVPAHTLSVGYMFPDYHKAGDEWQKLDYNNLAKVDQTIAVAAYMVADSIEVPKWNDIPDTQRYIRARQDTMGK